MAPSAKALKLISALRLVRVETISTRMPDRAFNSRGSASSPSITGISMSSRTMSGALRDYVLDGKLAVGVARDDFEAGLFLDPAGDEAAHHGGIVDNHDSDWPLGQRRTGWERFPRHTCSPPH